MNSTLLVRSLLALMLFVAAGCGDYARRGDRGNLLIHPKDAAVLGYAVNWSASLDVPGRHNLSSATLLEDILVTVEAPGNLATAISVRDGSILWRQVIGEATENVYPPIRDENHVYFNNDTTFYTVSATSGDLLATSHLDHVVETGPVKFGSFAIFGAANGIVFAHDIETGYAKWSYQMSGGIVVPPVLNQRNVFVADSKGIYALIEAGTGTLMFRGRTYGPVTATPASNQTGNYVASHDQSLYAINRFTESDKWVYRSDRPLTEAPVALGQAVYLPLPNSGLVALSVADGDQLWHTEVNAVALAKSGDKIMLKIPNGLQWVDEKTGRVIADAPTQPLQYVIPVTDQGGLLVVSPGGRIHRLLPKR